MYQDLLKTIGLVKSEPLSSERQKILQVLIDYILKKAGEKKEANLNFICTHNSRRSQLAQVWAQTAAHYYGVKANCFSGGVEITAFNPRAVAALERAGFVISSGPDDNPIYSIRFDGQAGPIKAFSKIYDNPVNPSKEFAAIMTCSDADENCPYIPGTEQRIPVRYDDPKISDGTPSEKEVYDQRSTQIASEMFYVFSKIK